MMEKNLNRLIVSLDVPDIKEAEKLVSLLSCVVDIFKVGIQPFTAYGPQIIRMIQEKGKKVFLDLKYHDIPSIVAKAVKQALKLEVWALTIHTSGGFSMLKDAQRSLKKEAFNLHLNKPLILGVTVLTSLRERDLNQIGINRKVEKQVKRLAIMSHDAELDGVISSPREIRLIRKYCGENFVIITPGIRPEGTQTNDQKRNFTPLQAIKEGADYIIVGRPIIEADNPLQIASQISEEIKTTKESKN